MGTQIRERGSPMETTDNTTDLARYAKEKIKLLRRDFHVPLTETEINHISALKSDIAIDNYARGLILAKLNGTVF